MKLQQPVKTEDKNDSGEADGEEDQPPEYPRKRPKDHGKVAEYGGDSGELPGAQGQREYQTDGSGAGAAPPPAILI